MAGQDSFLHVTTRARINVPQGQNATFFVNSAIAQNPDDVNARFLVRHANGTYEPLSGGAPGSGYTVDIDSVSSGGGTIETLTATPSFGLPEDYNYVWTLESSNNVNSNPGFGANVDNTQVVSNADVDTAEGLIKVVTTHIATGAVAEAYYWVALAGNIG